MTLKIMLGDKDISSLVNEAKVAYDEVASKISESNVRVLALSLSKLITEKLNQLSFNNANFQN